ncbi:transposable element Tcb1 transposase [Trichonephila clavipes]|nr:transposable element Tcb1 transposase [Trichonephila clavipes]
MMIPAYNKKGSAAFHSRWEFITDESPTSLPEENTSMPFSGFEPEPTRLQAECHIHHTGSPPSYNAECDRYLAVTAKRKRRSTASDLSRQPSSATGTTVSRQTVYRRLGHIGLYARRPVRCAPLTATHCRLQLTWSREHALWTPQQWSCVMVSDESRFSLQSDSRRTLIWRAPGTRYHQENIIERHRYGGAKWLVRGGIILVFRTDLHVQSVTMTGRIYPDVILEQHVRLFRGAMGAEFLFMDDNARPHRANIVDECLQSEDITRMDWPAYSPDLNPIEHVWDMLDRRIAARQLPPTCLPELRRALLDEWCNIPQALSPLASLLVFFSPFVGILLFRLYI